MRICLLLACVSLFGSFAGAGRAQQAHRVIVTQRGINEMAASVEAARRALLDDAGLRKPGEAVTPYLRRIALPLPAESRGGYLARINGYFALLEQSAKATKTARSLPVLRDGSAANIAEWKRLVIALQYLPARLQKMERAWQLTNYLVSNLDAAPSVPSTHFDRELEQTVQIVIAANEGLRDVKP